MKQKFKIEWMHCASCSGLIEKTLSNKKWVNSISVNIATNSWKIDFNENEISFTDIKKEVEKLGFKVVDEIKKDYTKLYLNKFILSLIFSLPVAGSMFLKIESNFYDLMSLILAFFVVFVFWLNFHIWFLKKLKQFQFNMDSLVSLWTLTAYFYSIYAYINWVDFHHFLEWASFIITFILLGKYLENKSKWKAWEAIKKLLELQEKKAAVIVNWKEVLKNIDDIKVGEVIILKAWSKVSLDWKIINWEASIDEAMLTWESIPVEKKTWDDVYSGTIVLNWNLEIKVEKEVWDTALQKIIDMVEDAQTKKAPIEHLADKVSWIFVPAVILIAIVTFIVWYYLIWVSFDKSLLVMVSVLVIACPCALWLATPTAIMVASWKWALSWILLKTPEVLEKSWKVDVVVFDKTWTLTEWKPQVNQIIPYEISNEELLKIANSLASKSNHPLSKAISEYTSNKYNVSDFIEIAWKWLTGNYKWHEILLWNSKLLKEKWYNLLEIENLNKENTPLYVWKNKEVIWVIWLLDLPKKTAKDTILKLKEKGIETYMITGDNKTTAEAIWNMIWIKNIISEVLPEDKKLEIEKIQKTWKFVAFVWDWINDSPALAQSDLWIWIWTWSDVAIETAWIVLVSWEPKKVLDAINLSKWTYSIIKQNLFWAFFYNTIMIPIAFMGLLLPMFAALAMSLSSVSVVLNSLRIKYIKL